MSRGPVLLHKAVLWFFALTAGFAAAQNVTNSTTYPTILAAIQDPALNLTTLAQLVNYTLSSAPNSSALAFLTNETFQGVMLAPTDAAFQAFATIQNTTGNFSDSVLASILLYHVVPDETFIDIAETYPTLLPSSANVTGTWTTAGYSNDQVLIGGVIPGVLADPVKNVTAANAIVYLTNDNVLIPPTNPDIFGQPLTLAIGDYLAGNGNYTELLSLANSTNLVEFLTSVDTMITLFAPNDAAFQSSNLNLTGMSGNDTSRVLYNHVLANPLPYVYLTPGEFTLPTANNPDDALTFTLPEDPSQPMTVQGAGNSSPVNITGVALSGKSIIYEIDGVLLPGSSDGPRQL